MLELCHFTGVISESPPLACLAPWLLLNSMEFSVSPGSRDPSSDPGAHSGAGCADPEGRSLSISAGEHWQALGQCSTVSQAELKAQLPLFLSVPERNNEI